MGRGSTEFGSLDEWTKHSTRGSGGGKFLSGWKKTGHCDTWMHTKRLPLAIWRHPWPTIQIVEDRQTKTKTKRVFTKKFTCHEDESILTHPWRDKITNEREHPPKRCGLCKLIDWLYMECAKWLDTHSWDAESKKWKENKKGKGEGIDPCTLVFNYTSEDSPDDNTKLYAGGICNFFGKKDPPEDLTLAMRANKIRGDETWKQNCTVKCEYALTIVDNGDVAAGCQIAVETQALGEKIKEVITKTWQSSEMNIQKTPYMIKWTYDEKQQFSKKYDALAMLKTQPSPRVLKLIRGDAPDLTPLKESFNQASMRATLEQNCLIDDVPWDDFFPTKEQEAAWTKEDEADEKLSREEEESETDDEDASESDDGDDDDAPGSEDADDDDDMVKCDECEKPIKLSAKKCPHCGHKYGDEEEEETEPEEKPKLRSRSEAKASKKSASKSSTKSKKSEDEDDNQDDDVPF